MTPAYRFRQAAEPNRARAEPVQIWKARRFIEEYSAEELSLGKVAQAVDISANYLSETFKRVTGVNFVHYVTRTRFEKARHLLEEKNLRISEIAFAVGFQCSRNSIARSKKSSVGLQPNFEQPFADAA